MEEKPELFVKQLGIKPGVVVALRNAPPQFVTALRRSLPTDASLAADDGESLASALILLLWPHDMTDLMANIGLRLKASDSQSAVTWVVIPKKPVAVKRGSDLLFQDVLDMVLPTGLVDNKTLTFSEEEYGIRFVLRRRLSNLQTVR